MQGLGNRFICEPNFRCTEVPDILSFPLWFQAVGSSEIGRCLWNKHLLHCLFLEELHFVISGPLLFPLYLYKWKQTLEKIFLITFTQNLCVCTRKGFYHMARIRRLFDSTSEQVTIELVTSIIHLINFFFLFLLCHTWNFKKPQAAAIRIKDNYTYEYYIYHKHSIYSDHLQLVINNKMKFLKFS